jgi:hypothetical protein
VIFPENVVFGLVVQVLMPAGPETVQTTVPVGATPPLPVTTAVKTKVELMPEPLPVRTIFPVGAIRPTVTVTGKVAANAV